MPGLVGVQVWAGKSGNYAASWLSRTRVGQKPFADIKPIHPFSIFTFPVQHHSKPEGNRSNSGAQGRHWMEATEQQFKSISSSKVTGTLTVCYSYSGLTLTLHIMSHFYRDTKSPCRLHSVSLFVTSCFPLLLDVMLTNGYSPTTGSLTDKFIVAVSNSWWWYSAVAEFSIVICNYHYWKGIL